MPSPAAHGIVGLTIGIAWFVPRVHGIKELLQKTWTLRAPLLACMLLACAPDIDYLFGIPSGNLNTYHQTATHTALWISALASALWAAGWPERTWRSFLFLLLLLGSHLLLDYLCEDNSKPYGMMLGWPFDLRYCLSPVTVFPAAAKAGLRDLLLLQNVWVVFIELIITLPITGIVLAHKLTAMPSSEQAPS